MAAVEAAEAGWRKAGPEAWVGVSLEILDRINKASFEIANAVMHTTGQAFVMAFQAGGPHAQDRGLEAVAYAWDQMRRVPAQAMWEKPQGRNEPLRMEKRFRIVPRGVALVIGCSTFPTWNGYPAHFREPRDRQCGHRQAASERDPAARDHRAHRARRAGAKAASIPNVVTLVAHDAGDNIAQTLALRPEIKIVDFTGSTANGRWLEEHARQAQVYTEKAGVNQVIIDSAADFKGLVRNLAFSLALYAGQMCTAPQNIYVPKDGIDTAGGPPDVRRGRGRRSRRASTSCSPTTRARSRCSAPSPTTACCAGSRPRARSATSRSTRERSPHAQFPDATIRTPLIVKLAQGAIVRRTSTNGSGRSRSSSRPTAPPTASRSRATPSSATAR